MNKLEGKTALITGGTSGIGLATAKAFVNEAAYTFITGRREAELAAAVKEIGRNVTGIQGDVSNLGELDRLYAQIKREKGKLDIVFANAGVAKFAALGAITEELYDWTFDINVKGLLFTVQKALPLLPDGASIILNSSVVGSKGLPINSVYSATKAAIRSFARTWTTDLKDRHIRVNAVSPGSIDTPGLSGLLGSSETGQQRLKNISNNVPLGRLGTPDEIAKAVVFSCLRRRKLCHRSRVVCRRRLRASVGAVNRRTVIHRECERACSRWARIRRCRARPSHLASTARNRLCASFPRSPDPYRLSQQTSPILHVTMM
jgi:NAD(P)-dependent dehydrogenase (short-subunit alcohol dehydrogenase family)